ncbi:MAG: PEP/pyruvate-binding domain-containing protein, partial [Actinomycetota bacterium]|nr:PEP/pyruvate-binding domain-containing protein [Actinomycetota bacterium]
LDGALTEVRLAELRPAIGGKAAGVLALAAAAVTVPEHPAAITLRPYLEHVAEVQAELDAVLADRDFATSERIRYLVLEGGDDFAERYVSDGDAEARAAFEAAHAGDLVSDVLEAGGFKKYFRSVPIESSTLATIEAELATVFADHSADQGLRFRSSSSVEDIDGFNGAGLYDSNSGFLQPDPDSDDTRRTRSVEWALLKTWASYWSAEAYEERELEGVDHQSGAMGVLVHARFDDELEASNGVFTFTVSPGDARLSMELNVQVGAESVTNPDVSAGASPEVVSVAEQVDDVTIERRQQSSRADGPVLDDEQLTEIFEAAKLVTSQWLDRLNAGLAAEQQRTTLTLDFEFRQMSPGWPALAEGEPHPARIVIKQARSLEPGVRHLSDEVLALPVGRDVLARASRIELVTCPNDEFVRLWTRPLTVPDFGYSDEPLIVDLTGEGAGAGAPAEEQEAENDGCAFDTLHSSAEHLLLALFPQ